MILLVWKYNKGKFIGKHTFLSNVDGEWYSVDIKFKNNEVVKQGKTKKVEFGRDKKIIAWGFVCILLLIALLAYLKDRRSIKMEFLREYNKKNKTKFKTHKDLQDYLDGRTVKKIPKKTTISSKAPLEATEIDTSSVSQLGSRLKKLKKMYKDGILSKVEFEKAKNKLLK